MTNNNLRKQMLCFAYLAYTGEGLTTPTAQANAVIATNITNGIAAINTSANNLIEGWSIVWGPAAYTVPGALYQDNMFYIVRNGTSNQYVIAVRGTNFISEVDWLLEDFQIENTMPWPMPGAASKAQPGAAMTESTSIDMNVALSVTDSSQRTMLNFLLVQTSNDNPIQVCVTGHSLGGVLSSTLALYMSENPATWDQTINNTSTVSAVCFAAPSAGNDLFAQNSNNVFADTIQYGSFPGWDATLKTNLDNVACDLDGAPQMYVGPNLYDAGSGEAGPLLSMYGSDINFGNLITPDSEEYDDFFVPYVLGSISAIMYTQNYTQLTPPAGSSQALLAGSYTGTAPSSSIFDDPCSNFDLKNYLDAFGAQAAWQHSYSYPTILGVPEVLNSNIVVRGFAAAPAPTAASVVQSGEITVTFTITGSGFSPLNLPQWGTTNVLETAGNMVNLSMSSGVQPTPVIIWATGSEICFQITNYNSISDGTLSVTVTTVNGTSNTVQTEIS